MRKPLIIASCLLAALAAAGMPWLAWQEARRQAYEAEGGLVLNHAVDVLHRAEQTSRQARQGMERMARMRLAPCSPQALDMMRRIDLTSTNLQAIGYREGDTLVCSSLGLAPAALGRRSFRTSTGFEFYPKVPIADATGELMALARGPWAVLIHRDLPLDIGSAAAGVALAVVHLEARRANDLPISRGRIDRAWLVRLGAHRSITFVDGGYLVAIVRSTGLPLAGIAAVPVAQLEQRTRTIAQRLVPVGLAIGLALAVAVLLLARERTSLASALRMALRRNEFFLVYQPIVEVASGRWVGAEALLRWRRATGELIRPDLFIPVAEQNGLIRHITRRVLHLVEVDAGAWLARHPGFHIAVNLAADDLRSPALMEQVNGFLASTGAAPSNLLVEITERGVLDIDSARDTIAALRSRGIEVAIDDFGTGYSSLSYLESLDLDFLKIDRSFIEAIGTGAPTSQVVGHIISMATTLGLRMIAEGIERPEQADFVRAQGVPFAQGWLYARPMPFEELAARLAERDAAGQGSSE